MIDISYRDYKRLDIHGVVSYPAMMIAPMQEVVMSNYINNDTNSIIDPFCGSGTSLMAALNIKKGLRLVGNDINPFANLITKTKLLGVDSSVVMDIEYFRKGLNSQTKGKTSFNFAGIEKWFRVDIVESLSYIRELITQVQNRRNRLFFWCVFADILRRYSNSRSSTFKLHIKEKRAIDLLVNNVANDFLSQVTQGYVFFLHAPYRSEVYKEDTLKLLPQFKDREFDMIVTSPPYGDNATTVTYGQFSWFALNWIDSQDLEMDGWERETSSILDSKSMGGSRCIRVHRLDEVQQELIKPSVSAICLKKQKKVLNFFEDYFCFLDEAARITGRYIIMTLGNRTVDRVKISLSDITAKYLETKGYVIRERLSRDIPRKRIPRVVSRVNGLAVASMNKEYVVVAERRS